VIDELLFWVIGGPIYAFLGSMTGTRFMDWRMNVCKRCTELRNAGGVIEEYDRHYDRTEKITKCHTEHDSAAFFAGAIWPVVLPTVGGHLVARRTGRATRAERRRLSRLEEARADLAVEKVKLEEEKIVNQRLELAGKRDLTSGR
jgi:hypothetical protein